jgi:L-alanine-DL-glutamate epimerase-like enolase superfamily enzyme
MRRIPVYTSKLYSQKLRFGWGPVDGAAGMERNVELVKTVRDVIGYEIDLMADAYIGWNLDTRGACCRCLRLIACACWKSL